MTDDVDRTAAQNALAAFADAVSDPVWRRQFTGSPDAALEERQISGGDIPDQVLGFLKGLSEEELRMVANLGSVMIDAGLTEETEGGVNFWHF